MFNSTSRQVVVVVVVVLGVVVVLVIIAKKVVQLRSGCCAQLNSYRHRLNPIVPGACTDCNTTPHIVSRLFESLKNLTGLTPVNI